ncbi:hypothetical protein L484_016881 [Morus notabilis]|uniref:Uncharacterized protein n=1 Tax=Morus notabilis TaxID=981085 RepID=W9RL02_9ROSA|nr:hypothetical protein L484_016881 [Morus notabilis]
MGCAGPAHGPIYVGPAQPINIYGLGRALNNVGPCRPMPSLCQDGPGPAHGPRPIVAYLQQKEGQNPEINPVVSSEHGSSEKNPRHDGNSEKPGRPEFCRQRKESDESDESAQRRSGTSGGTANRRAQPPAAGNPPDRLDQL